MRLPFLKPAATTSEPLVVAMTGVRLGDAIVFSGSSPSLALPLAARVGLSGRCVVIGPHAAALEAKATREGILVEAADSPAATSTFELAVVEATEGWADAAAAVRPLVRAGGRIVVVSGSPRAGLLARLRSPGSTPVPSDSIVSTLAALQWHRPRPIGEREGLAFVEAFS